MSTTAARKAGWRRGAAVCGSDRRLPRARLGSGDSPIITSITFQDVARTNAAVAIVVGYSGATVIMERRNGAWRALRLVNQWIT